MSIYAIKSLHTDLERLKHFGGANKETSTRFADYKDKVIDLLKRVCTVSVKTMKIIKQMPE